MAPPAGRVQSETGTYRTEFKMKLWLYVPFSLVFEPHYFIFSSYMIPDNTGQATRVQAVCFT